MRWFILALILAAIAPGLQAQERRFDFRGSKFDNDAFRFDPNNIAQNFIQPEDAGLRIHLEGKVPSRACGIYWNYRVRGDFTATVRYEILQTERPKKGYGVGIEMYVALEGPAANGLAWARLVRPEAGPVFNYSHRLDDENKNR